MGAGVCVRTVFLPPASQSHLQTTSYLCVCLCVRGAPLLSCSALRTTPQTPPVLQKHRSAMTMNDERETRIEE